MSSLTRTILFTVLFAATIGAAAAKDRPNTLDSLRGVYAEKPEFCRAYWRNGVNLEIQFRKIKGKYYYSDCHSSRTCVFQVVSHTSSPRGLVLHLRYTVATGEPPVKLTIEHDGNDQFVFTREDVAPTTRIRCTDADIAAGIGVEVPAEDAWDPLFAAYYALAVPSVCPALAADRDEAAQRIGRYDAKKASEMRKWVVKFDKDNIKDYCRKVLGAFGANGRVIPGLLHPARGKR